MKFGLILGAVFLTFSGFTARAQSEIDPNSEIYPSLKVVLPAKVSTAWFAGWHESQFPPSQVPWKKYTHLTYAFALTTSDPTKLDESGLVGLPSFVLEARKNGVRPLVSIGGWTGSRYFSTAVATPSSRTSFVKAVTDLAVKYRVDGLDFDWEYPNGVGVGCNSRDPQDTPNFLLFLKELRTHPVGKILAVTAAAGGSPWLGANGNPATDVSDFATVLDYVAIMNYDVWGTWSPTVGPNAPLYDNCASPANQAGSAFSSVQAWKNAGMPLSKLVLGVPSYGHSYRVRKQDAFATEELMLYPKFDANDQPAGDKWDGQPGETDICGVTSTKPGGAIQYWGMIDLGYIDQNGDPKPGRTYTFDSCSRTPFIYDSDKEIMVSYDDPESMRAKGQFIQEQKLRGFSMWEVGGDYHLLLVNAIQSPF